MKIDKMIPQFTKDEIEIIAQTFSTYRFENNEEGLYYKCKGEKGKIAFVTGYVQMGLLSGWIHTLEHTPGYISISIPQDKTSFIGIMKFLIGIIKGMGSRRIKYALRGLYRQHGKSGKISTLRI